MNASKVLSNYETLLALTGQMQEAAILGEWEQLIGIEHQRDQLVAAMKALEAEVILDESGRQYKKQLINEILGYDAGIRSLVEAWMAQLQLSMQSNRQEQRLVQAYRA